jgi:hypothetical protein
MKGFNDAVKRKERLNVHNVGADQCDAVCRCGQRCVQSILTHSGPHKCLAGHQFDEAPPI